MTQTATGLPNGGVAANYAITYDDGLSAADGLNRATALMGACDTDFNTMQGWFGGISLPYAVPYAVQIVPGSGWSADWGSGPPVTLVPLLVSEVTEMFMLQQGLGGPHWPAAKARQAKASRTFSRPSY